MERLIEADRIEPHCYNKEYECGMINTKRNYEKK